MDWRMIGLEVGVRERLLITPTIQQSITPYFGWSPRLVSRQRLLLFREALICLSYSGKWSSRAVTLRVLSLIRRVLCS